MAQKTSFLIASRHNKLPLWLDKYKSHKSRESVCRPTTDDSRNKDRQYSAVKCGGLAQSAPGSLKAEYQVRKNNTT